MYTLNVCKYMNEPSFGRTLVKKGLLYIFICIYI